MHICNVSVGTFWEFKYLLTNGTNQNKKWTQSYNLKKYIDDKNKSIYSSHLFKF